MRSLSRREPYFSDSDYEQDMRKDSDWFKDYLGHLRKRRRKAVRQTAIPDLDSDSDDDKAFPRFKQKHASEFFSASEDMKKDYRSAKEPKENEYPRFTYFRDYDDSKNSGPSPNERRLTEKALKQMQLEREEESKNRPKHTYRDIYGAKDYYQIGHDRMDRIYTERENFKERDRKLKSELQYSEFDKPFIPERARYGIEIQRNRRDTKFSNYPPPSNQERKPLSDHPNAENVRTTDIRSPRQNRTSDFSASTTKLFKDQMDSQTRKIDNIYESIRNLEREKGMHESSMLGLQEEIRHLKDKVSSNRVKENDKKIEQLRSEVMENFSKMQTQMEKVTNNQAKVTRSEDLITTLVSDISDIKKLFRDEVFTLKQELSDIKSKVASVDKNNSDLGKDVVQLSKKIDQTDQKLEESSDISRQAVRESLRYNSVLNEPTTKEGFEISDIRSALLDIDERMKSIEKSKPSSSKHEMDFEYTSPSRVNPVPRGAGSSLPPLSDDFRSDLHEKDQQRNERWKDNARDKVSDFDLDTLTTRSDRSFHLDDGVSLTDGFNDVNRTLTPSFGSLDDLSEF